MIGLRFTVFVFLAALCLSGAEVLTPARAQDSPAPLRPEIEVNTTVLDELEGYTPPPMFGAPGRPALSRPIERLALPARKASPDSPKSRAERDGLRLARPIIEPARPSPDKAAPAKPDPAPPRLAETGDDSASVAAPIPPSKPRTKTAAAPVKSESVRIAKAPPPPAPPARARTPAPSLAPKAARTAIVKALPSAPASARPESNAAPPMPAMPAQDVSQEALKAPLETAKTADKKRANPKPSAPPPPTSGEELLEAPETTLSSAAETLAALEPAAGQTANASSKNIDITAYEAPDRPLVPVSADISAGPALRHPPAPGKTASPEARRPGLLEEASLMFRKGQSDLDSAQTTPLKTKISTALVKNTRARIQILSYASAADGGQSSARRMSLLRALSVRSWLVSRGISPARIDVRALGETSGTGTSDRIDLVVYDPARKS